MSAAESPLLEVDGLSSRFRVRRGVFGSQSSTVHAAENVSFSVGAGEIVGLIGESGSGKSTVGRAIVRLEKAASGSVVFDGEDVLGFSGQALKRYRRKVQAVFQDPGASLNPTMRVKDVVAEPLLVHRIGDRHDRNDRVVRLLRQVGLGSDALGRYPHEFSGGQRQRIGMARALAVGPRLIVADEPVSALDVSVQAQVINLLQELRQKLGLALLFISHDLPTVEFLCDRVVVMYLGRVMEIAPAEDFQASPLHPYSRMLVDDAPRFGRALRRSTPDAGPDAGPDTGGDTGAQASVSPLPPVGCVFRTRCPHAIPDCGRATPALEPVTPDRSVACIRTELFS